MAVYAVRIGGTLAEVDKVALPYEKQIKMLLCEQANISACKYKETDQASNIYVQCREIELSLDYLKEKQRSVLAQWQKTGEQERMKLLAPVMDGIEKMAALASQMGCEAAGEYLEAVMMEELLDMLDLPE